MTCWASHSTPRPGGAFLRYPGKGCDAIQSAANGETSRFEFPFRNAQGLVWTLDFTLYPVFGRRGEVAYLIPSARDITQRKLAEHALRVTQFVMDNASIAILQLAPDGLILYANNSCSSLLAYHRNDLLTQRISDIDLQLPATEWPKRWKELKQRNVLRFESVYRHMDRHEIAVDVSASYIEYNGEEYCFSMCWLSRNARRRKGASIT
jgi:PAS domain-containing protein